MILSVKKDLDSYHAYQMRIEKTDQMVFMRCFGGCPDFQEGEHWSLSYRLYQPHGRSCYSAICHYSGYAGVFATLVKGKGNHRLGIGNQFNVHENYVSLLRAWFEAPSTVAIFSALALNDKRFFTRDIWQLFKRTGTSHLVAMSGLHVGLLVGLLCRLMMSAVAFCFPSFSSRRAIAIRFVLVLSVGVSLFFLVNSSYSIERALLMYGLSVCVLLAGSHLSIKSLLAYAALILLFLDPAIVFSVGAWLSFFTVFVLAHYSRRLSSLDNLWFSGPARHLLIFVFLMPVCLYFFHSVSLLAPFANMVAIPWFSLTVIPLLVLSLCASFFSVTLAKSLALLASYFFQPIYAVLQWLAHLPHTQLQLGYFPLPLLLAALAAIHFCATGDWLLFNRSYVSMVSCICRYREKNEHNQ